MRIPARSRRVHISRIKDDLSRRYELSSRCTGTSRSGLKKMSHHYNLLALCRWKLEGVLNSGSLDHNLCAVLLELKEIHPKSSSIRDFNEMLKDVFNRLMKASDWRSDFRKENLCWFRSRSRRSKIRGITAGPPATETDLAIGSWISTVRLVAVDQTGNFRVPLFLPRSGATPEGCQASWLRTWLKKAQDSTDSTGTAQLDDRWVLTESAGKSSSAN